MNATDANAVQAWLSTAMTRRPQRVDEGAGHSAFGFAFCTLRHLCALLTLRLPKGLAWCCDLLLPARHLSFGRVTRRGLSGRWHSDLLHVSNRHNVKNRPHVVGNQEDLLPRWRYSFASTRFLRKTCVWERVVFPGRSHSVIAKCTSIVLLEPKVDVAPGERSAMLIPGLRSTL